MAELRHLAIGLLMPSPTNPRKSFDQAKLEELAASFRAHGVLQPLVVRPVPPERASAGGRLVFDELYEIVAGERRYRAAQIAGLAEVPCVPVEMTDAQVIEAQIIENALRDDVSPLEEADAYAALLEFSEYKETGDAMGHLAAKVQRSKSQIYARLKLRSLGKEGRELLAQGVMNPSVALDVARLQPKDQAKACKALYAAGGEVTLKAARDWIRGNLLLRVSEFPFDTTDPLLLPMAGPCSTCPKNTAVDPEAFKGEAGGKAGLCTDPACHKAKMQAREEQLVRELTERFGECYLVSSKYGKPKRPDVLSHDMYTWVGASTPGAKPALDVEPSWGPVKFEAKWIRPHLSKPTKSDAADREEETKRSQKIATTFRRSLMEAIVGASELKLDRRLIVAFLKASWHRMDRDSQRRVAQGLGMEPYVEEGGHNAGYKNYAILSDEWTELIPEERLAEIMMRMIAAYELSVSIYESSKHYEVPPHLGRMAQEVDVDALALLEEAQEAVKPRKLANLLTEPVATARPGLIWGLAPNTQPEVAPHPTESSAVSPSKEALLGPYDADEATRVRAWAVRVALRAEVGSILPIEPKSLGLLHRAQINQMGHNDPSYAISGILDVRGRNLKADPAGESFYAEAVPA